MLITLVVALYASFAVVDVFDKFLISKRKIQPLSYAFFTLVTGALILVAWPFTYQAIPTKFIFLNLFSGAYYALVIYIYYRVLSQGEVSRVVPFVFGIVPLFDVIISVLTGRSALSPVEFAAMSLLIPGALIIGFEPGKYLHKYLGLTVLSAFLFSSYNFLWQYGAQVGPSLNNLMWNRIGAAGIFLLVLVVPAARKNIFATEHIKQKTHTGFMFLLKQGIGGLNFILLSYFLTVGKIPIIDGLAGFRYVFLFVLSLILSFKYRHILEENIDRKIILQKVAAITLIFLGTLVLFNFVR